MCGKLAVPLDYGDPGGRQIKVAVTRLPARDQAHNLGQLFVNYGGPGGDAVRSTQRFGAKLFRPYRKRFDIVAVDPRGTGRSRPAVSCRVNQERAGIYRQPFTTPSNADPAKELARSKYYAHRCASRNAEIAPHLSTANVARDLDAVRAALGARKITYFGFSYGTLLGATYAALFGDHLRAAVLDGAADPQSYLQDPLRGIREQTAGFEGALDRYFAACRRARSDCKWTGPRSPRAAYDRLVRRADRHPIRARIRDDRRPVDGSAINVAISDDLYAKQFWPEITQALNRAKHGNGSLVRFLADDSYGRRKDGSYSPETDRYFMIGAAEQQYPADPAIYARADAAAFAAAPHFFFNSGYAELNYGVYTARDQDAYLGPFALPAAAPTPLVVGTTHDPATPYRSAKALVAQLGNARLLTMRGDGHTAYGGNSRCIDRAVDRYVISGKLPAEGRSCRQTVPFPPKPKRKRARGATAAAASHDSAGPWRRRFTVRR